MTTLLSSQISPTTRSEELFELDRFVAVLAATESFDDIESISCCAGKIVLLSGRVTSGTTYGTTLSKQCMSIVYQQYEDTALSHSAKFTEFDLGGTTDENRLSNNDNFLIY